MFIILFLIHYITFYYSVHGILNISSLFMSAMEYSFDTNVCICESLLSEMLVLAMVVDVLLFELSSSFILLGRIKTSRVLFLNFVDLLWDNRASVD